MKLWEIIRRITEADETELFSSVRLAFKNESSGRVIFYAASGFIDMYGNYVRLDDIVFSDEWSEILFDTRTMKQV